MFSETIIFACKCLVQCDLLRITETFSCKRACHKKSTEWPVSIVNKGSLLLAMQLMSDSLSIPYEIKSLFTPSKSEKDQRTSKKDQRINSQQHSNFSRSLSEHRLTQSKLFLWLVQLFWLQCKKWFTQPSMQFQYRLGMVNSKSFVGKVLLQIKWKFELIYAL